MSSAFSILCKGAAISLFLVFLGACAGNPPQEPEYESPPGLSSSASVGMSRGVTGIQMTYKNDASTLNMTLDPYDENLQIEMKRTPRPVENKETKPEPPPPKKDTVYVMPPPAQTSTVVSPAPTSVNVQLQLPPERRDSVQRAASEPKEEPPEEIMSADVTDEVLTDIRRAQEYFYKKDYSSALRLLKSAQGRRATSEGYALQGSVHYMLGDRDLARYFWSEALKLNPNLPEVIEALSKLEAKPGVP